MISLPRIRGGTVPKNDPCEDAILGIAAQDGTLVGAVADGVGGRRFGDLASLAALSVVRHQIETDPTAPFEELYRRVWERLVEENKTHPSLATTLTVARCHSNSVDVGHVGDCRAYHLRGFGIKTLTEDQNEAQFLLRQGVLDKKSAETYPRRNVLTSAMSAEVKYDLFLARANTSPGDRIILMSDGAYSVIKRRELAEINKSSDDLEQLFITLISTLNSRGVRDDASVVCIQM